MKIKFFKNSHGQNVTKVATFPRHPSSAQIKSNSSVDCISQKITSQTGHLYFLKNEYFSSIFHLETSIFH